MARISRKGRAALEEIFEPDVSCAVWGIEVTETDLYPGEVELVERAVEKRRTEFARGRSCARAALAGAGGDPRPIGVGPKREPLFPTGFVGSITHCEGFVGAVVADSSVVAGVGVDAEVRQRLKPQIVDMVLTDFERTGLGERSTGDGQVGGDGQADPLGSDEACVLFSAKEALFKAVFPLTGVWLGFGDVGLTVSGPTFSVGWTAEGIDVPELARLEGRWRIVDELVLTGCWVR